MTKIYNIQVLRAVSALLVLVFHLTAAMPWRFGPGEAGVDIFFTISGYIMAVLACRPDAAIKPFVLQRLARIAPFYWLCTAAGIALALAMPLAFPRMPVTPASIACSALFLPCPPSPGFDMPILLQGWTLNYEMGFYLIVALSLLVPLRVRGPVLLVALVANALAALVLGVFHPLMSPLTLEFASGVMIALAQGRVAVWRGQAGGRWAARVLVATGVVLLAAEWVLGLTDVFARVALHMWVGWVMVAGAVLGEPGGPPGPLWRSAAVLGDASYALYLTHLLVVIPMDQWLSAMDWAARTVLAGIVAVAMALAIHFAIERPLHRASSRALRRMVR